MIKKKKKKVLKMAFACALHCYEELMQDVSASKQ